MNALDPKQMGTDPIFLRAALSDGKWGPSPFARA